MKDPPEKETLIAIPDISGFSSFVTDTAIEHSQHIVSELLELIIDQNTLGLQVSEIEGDAVLFYKTGALPEVEEIWQWAQQTYLKFHEHLLIYERQRICQCGACKTAHELDLKFILDQGPTRQVKISSHEKLMGPALIQAHRLLKNDVPSDGYFLLSDGLLEKANASLPEEEGFTWIKGCNHYPHLGEVGYCYTLLEPLHSRVQTPEQRKDHFTIKRPAKEHILLDNDIQTVHQVVSDSSQKIYWVEGVEKVIHSQPDEIEKVGSRHLCVVQGQEIPLEAFKNESHNGSLEFVEIIPAPTGPMRDMAMVHTLTPQSEQKCLLEIELHFRTSWWLRPMQFFLRIMMKRMLRQSLRNLQQYLEGK